MSFLSHWLLVLLFVGVLIVMGYGTYLSGTTKCAYCRRPIKKSRSRREIVWYHVDRTAARHQAVPHEKGTPWPKVH